MAIVRDRMMQRNVVADAVRRSYAALQAGDFATARDLAAPHRPDPGAGLLHALGTAGAGAIADGAAALDVIARANPDALHPVLDLVALLGRHGRDPAPLLQAALALQPNHPGLLTIYGTHCAEVGPAEAAVDAFQHLAAAKPGDPAAWSNLGKALAAIGDYPAGEQAFARALSLRPGDPQIGLNRAVATLKSGQLREGWARFRARHGLPGHAPPLPGRELVGLDDVAGRTVLLVHDEGLGDSLQFIRYAPMLMARGARVLVSVPSPLARLFSANGLTVVAAVSASYDAWCRIPDLPGVFGTTLETVPGTLPYLMADPVLVAYWGTILPAGRRVGLVWAGAARPDAGARATDRIRSLPVEALTPLLGLPGVQWVSLQQGRPAPAGVFDAMTEVADFADTAAIIAGLDIVVSVDTSVAHLAGAIGKPVLLLDRFDNCWRWLAGRDDSPWYPGVLRIIRQETPGDWGGVIRRVAEALVEFSS